ncbi:transposase [Bacillus thuringiensis]|uniref:IS6 family transposase n=1 Tax=Bacillus thuringiensis TaxID=1428 RepID=A0A9W3SIN8_BACTU|nr:hypothetical protein BT246_64650 [Bacillus thuringiensis]MBH0338443.1 transposase [Bacillus thuringiensis]
MGYFKGKQFKKDIILVAVGYYCRFSLSYFAKSSGFQSIRHASRTIKGIETIQAIYKQRRSLKLDSAFSAYNELQKLVAVA